MGLWQWPRRVGLRVRRRGHVERLLCERTDQENVLPLRLPAFSNAWIVEY